MFANMLRADAYRFLRSRFAAVTGVAFCVVIGLFCLFNFADHASTSFAFGGPIGVTKDGVELIDGFVGFAYADPAHPLFWELVYSATCFTAATMFAIPITGMMITSSDDQNGITKIAVAQGQSQTRLFLSKVVLSVAVTGILWALHNAITLALVLVREDVSLTGHQVGQWAWLCLLIFLPQAVLMLLVSLVTLISRSRVMGLVLLVVLVLAAPILAAVVRAHPSRWADLTLGISPVWHLNRVSRAWAETQIVGHTWLMFALGVVLLGAASLAWLRRRELS
ncbi:MULTISPECIES: hypothetical protein [unclassified Luteococcus]|uniref:hypothetical protein n=1 Tax=unclassified Luteococcus TaxID=2639923 RepID=UPI00313AD413